MKGVKNNCMFFEISHPAHHVTQQNQSISLSFPQLVKKIKKYEANKTSSHFFW